MKNGFLTLTIKENEIVRIGSAEVFVRQSENGHIRIHIRAPQDIRVERPKQFVKPKDKDL